jgi:hypothetical protein
VSMNFAESRESKLSAIKIFDGRRAGFLQIK